jgi:hypothetical protein
MHHAGLLRLERNVLLFKNGLQPRLREAGDSLAKKTRVASTVEKIIIAQIWVSGRNSSNSLQASTWKPRFEEAKVALIKHVGLQGNAA